jgi:UDP-N-acetylglucosamine 4,6-dehydratase
MIKNSSILITGGTGSFAKAFVKRVLPDNPRRLVIFSRDEQKQEAMAREFDHPSLRWFIGDIRDLGRLTMAMRDIDYVIHAAALKIVPTAEYNPTECIATNVIGAENVMKAAIHVGVKQVVALSTDKAVNPVNLYGASKLAAEKIFMAAHSLAGDGGPQFSVVRYGNVVGSRGSVIPLFKQLATSGRDLPITHPEMTRFWISLDQAVEFVLMSMGIARGQDIFIPKIPSMKIMDLAMALAPNQRRVITGIRPGEKLHEVLLMADESRFAIEQDDCYVITPNRKGMVNNLPERFSYTSDTNQHWLNVERLREMIDEH